MTGATGFAGSHLVERLLHEEPEVAAWGNARGRSVPAQEDPRVRWTAVDLIDRPQVTAALAALRPGVVYHCAGVPHVAASWRDAGRTLHVNVIGTHHLLEGLEAAAHACPVLIVSSALVYRPSAHALREDHALGPTTPYGVSKLAQEMVATRLGDLRLFVARPFNHAGPRQSEDFVTASFAKQIAEIEAGRARPVLRVGNLDARRDITDVRDTVRAYRMIVARGRTFRPFNVCAGRAYRVGDLLDALIGMARTRVTLEHDPARVRPSDTPVLLGDRSRIAAEVGWEPEIPIEQTLADLLDYWRGVIARAPLPR